MIPKWITKHVLSVHSKQTATVYSRKMVIKLNLIAAMCENAGIGKNGDLPWRLKTEMAYFTKMTTETVDPGKKNIVIMGRRTWDSILPKFKPLSDRINLILTRSSIDISPYKDQVMACDSLDKAMEELEDNKLKGTYENVWVIGGSFVYKEAMSSKNFYRLYLTEIKKHFDCDTFMPPLGDNLKLVCDPRVSTETNEEKGIQFEYKVYENTLFKE